MESEDEDTFDCEIRNLVVAYHESNADEEFQVLSTKDIVHDMEDRMKDLNGVVEMPSTIIRILLSHFNWDNEKLIEKYFDQSPEQIFKEAHIVNPFIVHAKNAIPKTGKCDICLEDDKQDEFTGLDCGHRFCTICWKSYLKYKILSDGQSNYISCPAVKCDILVDDATVLRLIKEEQIICKYQHLITNSFVQCNRFLKWCPAPGCMYTIRVQSIEPRPVKCKCGHTFCYKCSELWHAPITCDMLEKWKCKLKEDPVTCEWIDKNTKECPQCKSPIEKNQGCNHMTCTQCKYEFCWLCLEHTKSTHSCNKIASNVSITAWSRYVHYRDRYMSHKSSLNFEKVLYRNNAEMQANNQSMELKFLTEALDVLCACRQALMYTYVFAFYVHTCNQSVIFEDNQTDLGIATERLAELLEIDMTPDNFAELRQKILNQYKYCDERRNILLDHVEDDSDIWRFRE